MMGNIGINISGGNVNLGNVSQGDGNTNTVQSQTLSVQGEQAFAEFFRQLEDLRSRHQGQADALQNEVAALKAALEKNQAGKGSLVDTARGLYEKYGWAGDLLKKLFVVLLPGWLP